MQTEPIVAQVEIPEAFGFLFDPPLGGVRWRVAYGGRGGAKSWQYARALLVHGLQRRLRILCTREYQSSIKDSVHRLLTDQIAAMSLDGFYDVKQTTVTGLNGTEFIFKGIKRDPQEVKSTEGVDICWVEEGQAVSEESWQVLIPTIRKDGSEIWVTFNPQLASDPTFKRLVSDPPENAIIRFITWTDNPWTTPVTRAEAEEMRRRDPEAYEHVYGGKPWTRSDVQVLSGKTRVDDFTPGENWSGPYYGADWGFAMDPTVLVRVWIGDSRLWIEYDERGIRWSNDDIARHFRRVPGSEDHEIRADGARPETISAIASRGFRIKAAPKWHGSVEDGVEHLRREYDEIVIHPRCTGWIQDATLWRYRTDPRTDEVLPKLRDGNDHGPDATRYALAPIIKRGRKRVGVLFAGMDDEDEAA